MKIVTRDRWFEVRHCYDGVGLIHEPYVRPFYRCNLWHIQGRDRDELLDSGSGLVSLRKQLPWLTSGRCWPWPATRISTTSPVTTSSTSACAPGRSRYPRQPRRRPHPAGAAYPGHSPGGISLWEEKTQTLFSGDVIYDGPPIEDAYHSNLDDYAASLARLHELPVRTVHFPSFSGERLKGMIDDWFKAHE